MAEQLGDLTRTHTCGALRVEDVGADVVLLGWVHRVRDLGGLLFIDIRDRSGVAQIVFDKRFHSLPSLFGGDPIKFGGAAILPQSLVVLASATVIVVVLWLFIDRTMLGKAVIATAANRLAARLIGVDTRSIVDFSFAVSAAIGAIAGILITPIALTSYDAGTLLALKGFAAAMLGGIGSAPGAVVGGLLIGMIEALSAGYISSNYKDAVAFLIILVVLIFIPQGLFGRAKVERV